MDNPLDTTAIGRIDEAARAIEEARLRNRKLQNGFKAGSNEWHTCESVDDKLFMALTALGK